MFKKILKIIGSFFLVLIILIVIVAVVFSIKSSNYVEEASPYIEENIADILSWDYERLQPLLTDAAKEAFETERGEKAYRFFSKLGAFKYIGEVSFSKASSGVTIAQGTYDVATFIMPAQFENGEASITLTLAKSNGSYLVHYIYIGSDVFLE